MSCSGCRVLRKGCSDECMLRHCLQGIQNPQAQAHATVFVAKFFGRAGLMSFVSAVPRSQRPYLFQSLLYEAVGRTINPVNGAVGLLWTGNWHLCQLAVETVLLGGALNPLSSDFTIDGRSGRGSVQAEDESFGSAVNSFDNPRDIIIGERSSTSRMFKGKVISGANIDGVENFQARDQGMPERAKKHRAATPSTEVSETTAFGSRLQGSTERRLLRLFY
ncbi:LOB domain-containing protein 38-like [Prosopis cineraria]|uniref:LOB domain-containing protein 38-like n=1 Tax=Prosopis cineraria TaxID=364024 RepID=UPI00240FFEBB|nr:LOB domain-containing protein 38-like [Prosopis cineraria]